MKLQKYNSFFYFKEYIINITMCCGVRV